MLEDIEAVVEENLSSLDGKYSASIDAGDDHFEVSIAMTVGSEPPDLEELAADLLNASGLTEGVIRKHYGSNTSYLYCREDPRVAREVRSRYSILPDGGQD